MPPHPAAPAAPTYPSPERASAGIEARIRHDGVVNLYRLTPLPVALGLGYVAVLVALGWETQSRTVLLGWAAIKVILALVRCHESRLFRLDPRAAERTTHWVRRYAVLMVLDAGTWGATVALFASRADPLLAACLLAGVVGVASLGLLTTFSHFRIALLFQTAALAPMMMHYAVVGGTGGWSLVASGFIYYVALAVEASRAHARHAEALRLRYANEAIAEQRAQALSRAESSDHAKTRFLAAVSHELRTPLNGILGVTELLRTRSGTEPFRRELEIVHGSGQHLLRLIGDLLDLSRLEVGRLAIDRAPFDVVDVVREVTDLLFPAARERRLEVELVFAPDLPRRVWGDAARVRQVLINLIGNALKFTEQGSVSVQVSGPPGRLRITVRDTGQGIAPEHIARVFEPFVQAGDGPGSRPGSGLGLTIARELARSMGGDITVTSEVSAGSRFVVDIEAEPAGDDTLGREEPAPPPRFAGRILVVDDNEVNAIVAVAMLERLGLASEVASDGTQALQMMGTRLYDAVLMDLQMPGVDGLTASRIWRASESGPRLPIVALTANASESDRAASLAAGMDGYLAKPFELRSLAAVLADHLMPARDESAPVPVRH